VGEPRAKPRVSGHRAGVTAVRETVETRPALHSLPHPLCLFDGELEASAIRGRDADAPAARVHSSRARTLMDNNIRFCAMGRRDELPTAFSATSTLPSARPRTRRECCSRSRSTTAAATELVDACRRQHAQLLADGRDLATLCDADIERNLYAPHRFRTRTSSFGRAARCG
jgi:undecaprenyl pyrophosphate synthase